MNFWKSILRILQNRPPPGLNARSRPDRIHRMTVPLFTLRIPQISKTERNLSTLKAS
jgi:hypothetical protein